MDNAPPPGPQGQTTGSPAPEALQPRADDGTPTSEATPPSSNATAQKEGKPPRRRTYRPSHKATFISLAVVILILAVNAVIIDFVLKRQTKTNNLANSGQVTISPSVLSKIGINNSNVGDSGVKLVVDPDAQFNSNVTVAGNENISGQLKLNSKFVATDASLTQLEAGNTSLSQLDVNGNSTLSNLSLRNGLAVSGTTQLNGDVTISQLLTVNDLVVAGSLSANSFSARSLTSTSTLTVAGHIITGGTAPGLTYGSLGSNGTASISGDDSAGTIQINAGGGGGSGTLVNITFRTAYGATPRVVISPVGSAVVLYVLNVSTKGFSIGGSLGTGQYVAVDYIVEQ